MKRGLAKLDLEETPRSAFEVRLGKLRERLAGTGSQLALVYGDVSRSSDIAYLTNLCLYWNEAVLAVPLDGKPALITKLSKRVQPWMKSTTVLDDIRSGPKLAEGIGKFMDERAGGRAGKICLVDLPWWPDQLVSSLARTLPGVEICDLAGAVSSLRRVPGTEELNLLREAIAALDGGVVAAWARGQDAHTRTGIAVRKTRLAGFQDSSVYYRTLTDGSQCIDVLGQYRYVWIRLAEACGGPMADLANSALATAFREIVPGRTERQISAAVRAGVDRRYRFTFSCVSHAHLETRGAYRLPGDLDVPLLDGEVVCATVTLAGEHGVISASDMLVVSPRGALALRGEAARAGGRIA